MTDHEDLVALLRARTPLLLIDSVAETDVVDGFRRAIVPSLRPLHRWGITGGLQRIDLDGDALAFALPDAQALADLVRVEGCARAADDYDLDALAAASEGCSGAEIEQVVAAASYAAVAGNAPPTQDGLPA